jgi:hypothetical protein
LARELALSQASGQAICKITCPDVEVANRLATALVQRRVAACVNLVPGITSVYHWQGEICREAAGRGGGAASVRSAGSAVDSGGPG